MSEPPPLCLSNESFGNWKTQAKSIMSTNNSPEEKSSVDPLVSPHSVEAIPEPLAQQPCDHDDSSQKKEHTPESSPETADEDENQIQNSEIYLTPSQASNQVLEAVLNIIEDEVIFNANDNPQEAPEKVHEISLRLSDSVPEIEDLDIFTTPTTEISHSVESVPSATQPEANITSHQQMEEENPQDSDNNHPHPNTQLHDGNETSPDPTDPQQQSVDDIVEFEKIGIKLSVNDELELSQPYSELNQTPPPLPIHDLTESSQSCSLDLASRKYRTRASNAYYKEEQNLDEHGSSSDSDEDLLTQCKTLETPGQESSTTTIESTQLKDTCKPSFSTAKKPKAIAQLGIDHFDPKCITDKEAKLRTDSPLHFFQALKVYVQVYGIKNRVTQIKKVKSGKVSIVKMLLTTAEFKEGSLKLNFGTGVLHAKCNRISEWINQARI